MTTATRGFSDIYEDDREPLNFVPSGLWPGGWPATTSHLGFPARFRVIAEIDVTTWAAAFEAVITSLAEEVRLLRDKIIELTGLTKQEIARGIGVDRRSLSGFVNGEIRPSEERLVALRFLADAAGAASARFGERAREVLRFQTDQGGALDLIASGRVPLSALIEEAAAGAGVSPKPAVTIRRREHRPPLYTKALEVWSDRIDRPGPGGVPRPESAYDQDLSLAPRSVSGQPTRPRRKRI